MPQTRTITQLKPTGMLGIFANATAPSGWLKCNGAAISRSAYADLFAIIGTTYGAGNGSTTFNLPDLRGEFFRGFDDGRGLDSGRVFGTWQAGTVENHDHGLGTYGSNNGITVSYSVAKSWPNKAANQMYNWNGSGGGSVSAYGPQGDPVTHKLQTSLNTRYLTDTVDETRPRNIALLFCIKY